MERKRRQKQKINFNRFLENRKEMGYGWAGQREPLSEGTARGRIPLRSMLMGSKTPEKLRLERRSYSRVESRDQPENE